MSVTRVTASAKTEKKSPAKPVTHLGSVNPMPFAYPTRYDIPFENVVKAKAKEDKEFLEQQ